MLRKCVINRDTQAEFGPIPSVSWAEAGQPGAGSRFETWHQSWQVLFALEGLATKRGAFLPQIRGTRPP